MGLGQDSPGKRKGMPDLSPALSGRRKKYKGWGSRGRKKHLPRANPKIFGANKRAVFLDGIVITANNVSFPSR